MTYQEIKVACTTAPTGRFDFATQDTEVGRWVNTVYARWWNAFAWPWRVAGDQALSITAGTRAYTLPASYGETWGMFDQNGGRISYLSPTDFLSLYSGTNIPSGQPSHYTLLGRDVDTYTGQVLFGPTPDITTSYKWQFLRKVCHFHTGTMAVTAGAMSDNGDVPIMGWSSTDVDYHYALVAGATAFGLQMSQAPANQWQPLQGMYESMLVQAVEAYGRANKGEHPGFDTRVWGNEYAEGLGWR